MTYNLTQLQAAYTVSDLVLYANNATGGILFLLLVCAVWFITFMSLLKWGMTDAGLTACFITLIFSSFLWISGLVSSATPLLLLAVTAIWIFIPSLLKAS